MFLRSLEQNKCAEFLSMVASQPLDIKIEDSGLVVQLFFCGLEHFLDWITGIFLFVMFWVFFSCLLGPAALIFIG